jgi:hypothetical protein
MPKPTPQYPGQTFPKAPDARTFAEMVDSKKAKARTIEARLGMTFRTYLKRREFPSELTLAEIRRLADWLGEPFERIAAELMAQTANDDKVLGKGIDRHPQGIDRTKKKQQDAPEADAD